MSLNSIIAEAIEANESAGTINRQGALNTAVPLILADEEMTERCVRGHATRLITSSKKKRKRQAEAASPAQLGFFGLAESYVVGNEDGNIKYTDALTRADFRSIIQVRQDQVLADLHQLDCLRRAETETRAIWDAHPEWTWGQVEAAYARAQTKAAPAREPAVASA